MKIGCVSLVPHKGQFVAINSNKGRGIILPGGKLEKGETFMEAATRELFEETGLVADNQIFLYQGPSSVNTNIICFTFLTYIDSKSFTILDKQKFPTNLPEGKPQLASWDELLKSVYRGYYEIIKQIYEEKFDNHHQ